MYAEIISGSNDHDSLYALGTRKLHGTEIPNREIFEFYYNSINEINSRFETFKQLKYRPTIKIIPGLVKTSIIEWCIQNLDCVFLDRKNKLDQIVSYGVAKYSSWWFNQGNKHLEPQCMEYLRPDFDYLISTIHEFNKLVELNKNIPIVFYEDIEVPTNPMIPLKNKQRGLELFSNKEQIIEWYNEFI
jgi:hypothetical protein